MAEVAGPDGGLAGAGTKAEVDQEFGLSETAGGFSFAEGKWCARLRPCVQVKAWHQHAPHL